MASYMMVSLDNSVLFIQQEHAKTLKALHEEIATLQKRCSDLTFQLTMGNSSIEEFSRLEQELISERQRGQELEEQLQSKNCELDLARNRLVILENEKEAELRHKKHLISSLEHELEEKASTITDLTAKVHGLKCKMAEKKEATLIGSRDLEKQLQSKNCELELVMKKLMTLESEKESELWQKCQLISSLERELEEKANTITELESNLHIMKLKEAEKVDAEKACSQALEEQLQMKNHELELVKKKLVTLENEKESELSQKSQLISSLEHELEEKAHTVSNLKAKLNNMKLEEAEKKESAKTGIQQLEEQLQSKNHELAFVRNELVMLENEKESDLRQKRQLISSLECDLKDKENMITDLKSKLHNIRHKESEKKETAILVPTNSQTAPKRSRNTASIKSSGSSSQSSTEKLVSSWPLTGSASQTKADVASASSSAGCKALVRAACTASGSVNVSTPMKACHESSSSPVSSRTRRRVLTPVVPVPPTELAPKVRRRTNIRTVPPDDNNRSNGESMSRSAGMSRQPPCQKTNINEVIPDPTPFLTSIRKVPLQKPKPLNRKPSILPPIAARSKSNLSTTMSDHVEAFGANVSRKDSPANVLQSSSRDLPRSVQSRTDSKAAKIEVLALDKADQLDITTKYNTTANCK